MELLLYAHENDPDCARVISGCKSNQLIELLCSKLWELLRVYRLKSSSVARRAAAAFRQHREIVQAVGRRDAGRAA
jgi:DNA-binding GntR family transcriptional regulator